MTLPVHILCIAKQGAASGHAVREIDRALADIADIRSHVAAGTLFQGFGPAVLAVTGCLALITAAAQSAWPQLLAPDPVTYFVIWVATACLAIALIGAEMVARSRRHHAGMAQAMILCAVEQFLPAGFAGAAIAAVLFAFSPESLWLLPGLWQVLVALGILASRRMLPSGTAHVGRWYLLAGLAVLMAGASSQSLSPWMMGVPFAVGQMMMAFVLRQASGEPDAQR